MKIAPVIVDTCAVIYLLTGKGAVFDATKAHVEKVVEEKRQLIIPSVVVAELRFRGRDGSKYVEDFAALAKGSLRVVTLSQAAGDVAGRMREQALAAHRGAAESVRGAVTYDALIAATAVQEKACAVLTGDRAYGPLFAIGDMKVDVRDVREMPAGAHLYLPLDLGPRVDPPGVVKKKRPKKKR